MLNSFFNAQLNYSPVNWMLHNHTNNNKMKHLHERCSWLIYSDKKSFYEALLDNLAAEKLNIKHDLCPEITGNIFMEEINYHHNLLKRKDVRTPLLKTVPFGTGSIAYPGPKIWDISSDNIEKKTSLNNFRESIRSVKLI